MKDGNQDLEQSYKVGIVTVVEHSVLYRSDPNPFLLLPEIQIQNYGKPCTSIWNLSPIFSYIRLNI